MKDAYTVALGVVKLSVQRSERSEDERYLMDYTKLHKLLYYAQCLSLAKYDAPIFYEDVVHHDSGPCVEELSRFYGDFGIGAYTAAQMAGVRMPEFSKKEKDIVVSVIGAFGRTPTADLVWMAKQSAPCLNRKRYGSVLSKDDMKEYARNEFKLPSPEQGGLDVAAYVRETRKLLKQYEQYLANTQHREKIAGSSQRASANKRVRKRNEYPRGTAARR